MDTDQQQPAVDGQTEACVTQETERETLLDRAASLEEHVSAEVRQWFKDHVMNSEISRHTAGLNHLSAALPALVKKIAARITSL